MTSGSPKKDYARLGTDVHHWVSIAEFLKSDIWRDGVHAIQMPNAPSLDLLINGNPLAAGTSVPVFFSGAVQNRDDKSGPFFSGFGMSVSENIPLISIADPSLELDKPVSLGWYVGNEKQSLVDDILSVLTSIIERSNNELLLIGGSGGGYAALMFGQRLGEKASAFVWNPQTDILEYNEKFVKDYLSAAFPVALANALNEFDWKARVREYFDRHNLQHSVLPDFEMKVETHRSLYIQQATDWHVRSHAAPYINANRAKHLGRGRYTIGRDNAIWILNYADGHDPLPQEYIAWAIKMMRDPTVSSFEVIASLSRRGLISKQPHGSEPQNLTSLTERIQQELNVSVVTLGQTVQVTVEMGEVPLGYGGLQFGYFAVNSLNVHRELKWYTPSRRISIPIADLNDNDTVRINVRDGFGNDLFSIDASTVVDASTVDAKSADVAARPRIFVYGSCVSRDAFQIDHNLHLVDYVARSAVGSAFAKGSLATPPNYDLIASKFQRRMVRLDIEKGLPRLLRDRDFDFLLVDFVDERLQMATRKGFIYTNSLEVQSTKLRHPSDRLIKFGSDEYLSLWRQGIASLLSLCPPSKIVVNRVFWATVTDDGQNLPEFEQIEYNNGILGRLYEEIGRSAGIRFIDYPENLIVADSNHKWGVSPFHYTEEAYEHLIKSLEQLTVVQS